MLADLGLDLRFGPPPIANLPTMAMTAPTPMIIAKHGEQRAQFGFRRKARAADFQRGKNALS
jgi:hypothetical protein